MSTLPVLPFWQARSFWAMSLTVILTLCNAAGVDLLGRLGTDEAGVLSAIDMTLPVATAFWAWLERRAPRYQLGLSAK